jgi:hypothetical protein
MWGLTVREAKANLSFGVYRQGKAYQVDESDQRVQALVGAGYLSYPELPEVQEDDRVDSGGPGNVSAPDVAVPEATQGSAEGVDNGEGQNGQDG